MRRVAAHSLRVACGTVDYGFPAGLRSFAMGIGVAGKPGAQVLTEVFVDGQRGDRDQRELGVHGPAELERRPGHHPAAARHLRPRRHRRPAHRRPGLELTGRPLGPAGQIAWAVSSRACSGSSAGIGRPTSDSTRPGSVIPSASHGGGASSTVAGSPAGYAAATR